MNPDNWEVPVQRRQYHLEIRPIEAPPSEHDKKVAAAIKERVMKRRESHEYV